VGEAVIEVLEKRIPAVRDAIEVCDVSTPATVHRYTGNWQGSMEGWFISPGSSLRPLPNTLEGLRQFMMVGQWVSPGGGLPSGLMTARNTLKAICRHDHVPFTPFAAKADVREAVAV
jgi:phytoene dehydrogenase-like protein